MSGSMDRMHDDEDESRRAPPTFNPAILPLLSPSPSPSPASYSMDSAALHPPNRDKSSSLEDQQGWNRSRDRTRRRSLMASEETILDDRAIESWQEGLNERRALTESKRGEERWSVWTTTSTLHSEGGVSRGVYDPQAPAEVKGKQSMESLSHLNVLEPRTGVMDLITPTLEMLQKSHNRSGSFASSSATPFTSSCLRKPRSSTATSTTTYTTDGLSAYQDECGGVEVCSTSQESDGAEEDDAALDRALTSSLAALQSAQQTLRTTLLDRSHLIRFRCSEAALERSMDKREVELLTQLETNRQMTEYMEKVTLELEEMLKGSSRQPPTRLYRNPSYTSWNLAGPNSEGAGGGKVGGSRGAAAKVTALEGGMTGIVEAPQDEGVTMGKTAARRLEKMLGRQSSTSGDRFSGMSKGSPRRSAGKDDKRDARSLLASLAAASSPTLATTAESEGSKEQSMEQPRETLEGLPERSILRAESFGQASIDSSAAISLAPSFSTTVSTTTTTATSEATAQSPISSSSSSRGTPSSKDRNDHDDNARGDAEVMQEEQDTDSVFKLTTSNLFGSPSPLLVPPPSGPAAPPLRTATSYFAGAVNKTKSNVTSSSGSALASGAGAGSAASGHRRRSPLHRSLGSAPAVVSTAAILPPASHGRVIQRMEAARPSTSSSVGGQAQGQAQGRGRGKREEEDLEALSSPTPSSSSAWNLASWIKFASSPAPPPPPPTSSFTPPPSSSTAAVGNGVGRGNSPLHRVSSEVDDDEEEQEEEQEGEGKDPSGKEDSHSSIQVKVNREVLE